MNWIVRSFSRTKSWLFSISVCSLDMWHWFALTQEMIAELRRETSSQIAAGSSVARRGMRHRQATLPHWFKMCQTFRFFPDLFLSVFKKTIKEKKNNMNIMLKKSQLLRQKADVLTSHHVDYTTCIYILYMYMTMPKFPGSPLFTTTTSNILPAITPCPSLFFSMFLPSCPSHFLAYLGTTECDSEPQLLLVYVGVHLKVLAKSYYEDRSYHVVSNSRKCVSSSPK